MKCQTVIFAKKEDAQLIECDMRDELAETEILVKTEFSAISAGTELANYHELPNTMVTLGKTNYPQYPGYSAAGRIERVGKEVKDLKVGDRVVMHWCGHRQYVLTQASNVVKIPEGVSSQEAAFTHISSFPFLGVRKLNLQLGESCMVAGLGILGLFAVQIAHLSGAFPVLACDFSPERRKMALELGADYAFDPQEPDFAEKVRAVTDGKGPNGVVEVTGFISALQQALEYIAYEGRITLLGCTRISDQTIDFYKYVHLRGIQLIGCHTFTRPKVDSCPGRWTEFDDYRTFLKFVAAGRMQVKPFINKIVSPRDTAAVYHEIGSLKNPPFGVLFDWNTL